MYLTGRLKRAALVAAMGVLTLNVFTGSPLLAAWVGSRVQGQGPPTMAGFGATALTLAGATYALVRLLARTGRAHDRLTGHRPTVGRHVPWLRHAAFERAAEENGAAGLSALEVILVLMVFAAAVAFEIWFIFYSPSPIDLRSGRD
jgi:hypothetical protein